MYTDPAAASLVYFKAIKGEREPKKTPAALFVFRLEVGGTHFGFFTDFDFQTHVCCHSLANMTAVPLRSAYLEP